MTIIYVKLLVLQRKDAKEDFMMSYSNVFYNASIMISFNLVANIN
jgi:hypothetical protein